jgi:protease-4
MPDIPEIPTVQPVGDSEPPRRPQPSEYVPPRRSLAGRLFGWFMRTFFLLSLFLNFLLLVLLIGGSAAGRLTERHHSGDPNAQEKIALVRVEGLLVEGFTDYAHRQLKDAAEDERVKAVVLAVNSPGGSVTASDNLYREIAALRDGTFPKQAGGKKPVIVSMGSVAASGGYYVSLPAEKIYAQPSTMTGSIGVYAAFLDLHAFAAEHKIGMNILQRGELKGSSMFKEMSKEERLHWENLLENSYQQFLALVRRSRNEQPAGKRLKYDLRTSFDVAVHNSTTGETKNLMRRLADGGVFTAQEAKDYGLIDEIGYLEDAVAEALRRVGLEKANVIAYDRPLSLFDSLLGIRSTTPATAEISLENVPGCTPRLWYLTPGYELEGFRLSLKVLR